LYKNKSILGIIPARGGSKGLPRKNIKLLLNKPLIAWTIEEAKKSKYLDRIIISTDDEEIAKISESFGAEVPFMRPQQLAQDSTPSYEVIKHCIEYFHQKMNVSYDYIALLEPTSPLRETSDIDNSIELLINNKSATSIVSIAQLDKIDLNYIFSVKEQFLISPFENNPNFSVKHKTRQEMEKLYFPDGTIYISETYEYLNKKTFYHEKTLAYIVDKYKSYEIDDILDFIIIETLLKHKKDY